MKQVLTVLTILLFSGFFSPETTHAQKMNFWEGGKAGRPTDWNYPRNWSLGRVPDQTCVAVIEPNFSNGACYPVISSNVERVWYLMLLPGARLEIRSGSLLEIELPEACLYEGDLISQGQIITGDEGFALIQNNLR